jgi:hypothetical protein
MPWTIDLQDLSGGAIASAVRFKSAAVTWTLDGPHSFEADIFTPTSTDWLFGRRKIVVKDSGGTARFAGYLYRLSADGPPGAIAYKVAGLGLASVLSRRVVHGDFSKTATVATTIAWNLIQHVQAQTDNDHAFTLGTITGTAPARSRDYCDGENIADAINELADFETGGFDWDILPTGAFTAWVGGRGSASGLTLLQADAMDWTVEAEVSDLSTYVTALGSSDEPCGAPLSTQVSTNAPPATWGRRETVIDIDSEDGAELTAKAAAELLGSGRARLRLTASYEDTRCPFTFGTVWLGDTVTINPGTIFGGSQTMRCIEITASLEPPALLWATYTFEAA